jgi:UPF0755 protein
MFAYRYKNIITTLAVIGFLVVSYIAISFALFLYAPASLSRDEVVVDVPSGTTFRSVTHILHEAGLLKSERKFLVLAKLRNAGSRIKSGELKFYKNMNPMEVLDNLLHGVPVTYTFTVPEGFNTYQMAQMFEEKGLIKHAADFVSATRDKQFLKELGVKADSLEGYLFPETYTVEKVKDVKSLIKLMYKKYRETFTPQMVEKAHELGFSEHEIVTMASIIEKETGAVDERRTVASVFYNRLKKGMRLQSDPTTIYGMWDNYRGNITRDDLQRYTPYNTYKVFGLPAGPIASPGKASIMAALYPNKTNYLFFVSRNDGTHVFTEDYGKHQKAVGKFQKNHSAREGKSWRDLSKRR